MELTSPDDATPPFFVGVDLGGTSIKVGVVDDAGRVVVRFSIPTQTRRGPEDGARRMGQAVLRAIEDAGIKKRDVGGVGLGTPGTMDIPSGMLIRPHNLPGWYNFPIRDRVAHHCGFPVAFANDANAAAYGEYWVGRGRDFHSMVLLTLGTGVGGGVIIGDRSIDGENSHGAELGHVIIDYNDTARPCPCGQLGHLEGYASATAVIQRTEEALGQGARGKGQAARKQRVKTSLRPRLEAGEKLTPLMLAEEAEQGDRFSVDLIMETAKYLGIGIVNHLHTIDPAGVVLGGSMTFGGSDSDLGRRFLARVQEEVHQRAFPVIADRITIDFATLGGNAGFIGVAGLARATVREQGTIPTYDATLRDNRLFDPSDPLSLEELAQAVWGKRSSGVKSSETAKRRLRDWMKTALLPAVRDGRAKYRVSQAVLTQLHAGKGTRLQQITEA